jgi:hypothetical protein
MSEQETHKQEADKAETVKPDAAGIVELNAEETEQVVGGNGHLIRQGPQNR